MILVCIFLKDDPDPVKAFHYDASELPRQDALFSIHVGDPQKRGNAAVAHVLYTVTTKTKVDGFRGHAFSVCAVSVFQPIVHADFQAERLRRYNDFLWLYNQLSHNNPGIIIPPVPDKQSLGRFSAIFVAQRRHALQTCINKTANHPLLSNDPDLKLFLESDNFSLDVS